MSLSRAFGDSSGLPSPQTSNTRAASTRARATMRSRTSGAKPAVLATSPAASGAVSPLRRHSSNPICTAMFAARSGLSRTHVLSVPDAPAASMSASSLSVSPRRLTFPS